MADIPTDAQLNVLRRAAQVEDGREDAPPGRRRCASVPNTRLAGQYDAADPGRSRGSGSGQGPKAELGA